MLFAIITKDIPGKLQVRLDNRAAHVDYLNALNEQKLVKFAGPFLDENGDTDGGMVVIEAADLDEARVIAQRDPFAKADLFSSVEIRPWAWLFNQPTDM